MNTIMQKELIDHIQKAYQELFNQPLEDELLGVIYNFDSQILADMSFNFSFKKAKILRLGPNQIAQQLVDKINETLSHDSYTLSAEKGYINIVMTPKYWIEKLTQYAQKNFNVEKKQQQVYFEYISSNPTGPLHIGHARGAILGSSLVSIMKKLGMEVFTEYYVNDAGRQIDILTLSVIMRLEKIAQYNPFPAAGYQGDYVFDYTQYATHLDNEYFSMTLKPKSIDYATLYELSEEKDKSQVADKWIDTLIALAKSELGVEFELLKDKLVELNISETIKTLKKLNIEFNNFAHEKDYVQKQGEILEKLKQSGFTYQDATGAIFLKSTEIENNSHLADDKDRVLVRSNGQATYFLNDLAYHEHKYQKGYERIIDIWGVDHHGYIPRVKNGLCALGLDDSQLDVILNQVAKLYQEEKEISISTRAGKFYTLDALIDDLGVEALYFFYNLKHPQDVLKINLDEVKNSYNPFWQVQYSYNRATHIFKNLDQTDLDNFDIHSLQGNMAQECISLLKQYEQYSNVLHKCVNENSPSYLVIYMQELARSFNQFYEKHNVMQSLGEEKNKLIAMVYAHKYIMEDIYQVLSLSHDYQMGKNKTLNS
jgi:arginyl-tRNA synthetase